MLAQAFTTQGKLWNRDALRELSCVLNNELVLHSQQDKLLGVSLR